MKHTTVKDLELLRAGSTVDGIIGTILKVYERKAGKNEHGEWSFQNASFRDETGATCKLKFKNHPEFSKANEGRKVEIVTVGDSKAKGVCVDEHNGEKSFLLYPTVEINYIDASRGAPPARQDAPPSRQEQPDDRTRSQEPPAREERREAPPASSQQRQPAKPDGKHIPIFGATCGMAINNAVAILSQGGHALSYFRSPEFSADVWKIASDLIRVSQTLEQGILAPAPKERRAPDTEAPRGSGPVDADNPDSYT